MKPYSSFWSCNNVWQQDGLFEIRVTRKSWEGILAFLAFYSVSSPLLVTFSYSFGSIRNLNCNSSFKTHCKFYLSMKFPPCFPEGLWFTSLHLGLKWSSVWTYWLLPTGLQIPCPVLEIPWRSKLHSCPQLVHILVAKGGMWNNLLHGVCRKDGVTDQIR